jgi:RimJ/RimL family protein N-acetyltransferase
MASCYGEEPSVGKLNDGTKEVANCCPYLPLRDSIKYKGVTAELFLSCFKDINEVEQGFKLMNDVITEGKSWPFMDTYATVEAYSSYFHSHASFAVRFADQNKYGTDILGCFYVKPNFPGRCSHICNGGFITSPKYRGLGVGTFMGRAFKRLAKDLGYRGSLFNLVFANNTASVKLWMKLGFTQLAVLPAAAVLRTGVAEETEVVDAIQMYFDLTKPNSEFID